ncbi:glycosyltransferase family 2 protein [Alkalimarinus coralli]|uniref:glycosyltransferase family 2 protein n=1 Tax=Alkalimarinus coralli TaxID=2935863 RepID=UPI00202B65CC|nr:glycosyltransferase family 2 protein [Alkalimarinus coralli]
MASEKEKHVNDAPAAVHDHIKQCVTAVIVTYMPNLESLSSLLKTLSGQCERMILVDNASNQNDQLSDLAKAYSCTTILLHENIGIAAAHNMGIIEAISLRSSHVLLMDQDSEPAPDMVYQLLKAEEEIKTFGHKVAAIGPEHRDARTNKPSPFISSKNISVGKVSSPDANARWCKADFIISSGSLIDINVFNDIGMMEEPLFIDCVDIEWGFRAASKGYQCFGAFDAKMIHAIGDKPLLLFGGARQITMHSPLRHYYFYRNLMVLCKRGYLPGSWKAHVLFKSILQLIIFSTLTKQRKEHFLMIVKGVYHGLTNRLGKL